MHINLLVRAFLYASTEHIFNYFTQNMHIKPAYTAFYMHTPHFFPVFPCVFRAKRNFSPKTKHWILRLHHVPLRMTRLSSIAA